MTTNKPYQPWKVKEKDFPSKGILESKLRFLLRYAILAPSSHNTQPWKFEIAGDQIKIFPDLSRSLIYSDRVHREMYVSLGCALANLIIAADYFKFSTKVDYLPEDEVDNVAVVVTFIDSEPSKSRGYLFPFITQRTSNRNPYLKKEINGNIFDDLNRINDEKNVEIHFVKDFQLKSKITEIVCESILFAFNDKIFKDELSQWVRSNYTKESDGMPLFGFGIPGPISIFAPLLIRYMPAIIQSKIDKVLLENSSALLLLSSQTDNRETWIKIGKIYEYLTLMCLKNSIATSPMAGVVEYEDTNKKLKKILNLKGRPFFFARMGFTDKLPHKTPRRNINDVLL